MTTTQWSVRSLDLIEEIQLLLTNLSLLIQQKKEKTVIAVNLLLSIENENRMAILIKPHMLCLVVMLIFD